MIELDVDQVLHVRPFLGAELNLGMVSSRLIELQ
jgi:hypothetical protein